MNSHALRQILMLAFFSASICHGQSPVKHGGTTPQQAVVGVHIMNVYQLDMTTNSFYADFYLWCRWKGDIDPLKNIEFINSEEEWGFSKTLLYDSAILLKDGERYNILHIQGKFHHNFILNNYPIDQQDINIVMENSIYSSADLRYSIDNVNSHIQPDILIPGWEIEKFFIRRSDHVYLTNFGLAENGSRDHYSNIAFSITLHRPVQFFIWKLLLPIIVVLLSGFGAVLIFPGYTDARIYAPVGALLTTVFLQQSSSSNLPDISYLILTDKIYVIVYIAILAGIFQAIVTANIVRDGSVESFRKAKRLDRAYVMGTSLYLLASVAVLFWMSRN